MSKFYFICKVDKSDYELKIKAETLETAVSKFNKQTRKAKNIKLIEILTEEQKAKRDEKKKNYFSSSSYHAQPNRRGKKNTRSVALYG